MFNMRDFATALITTPPNPASSGNTVVVETGKGVDFPAVPFKATMHPDFVYPDKYNAERVTVTAINGNTLTIERAKGETSAKQPVAGWRISNGFYSDDIKSIPSLRDINQPYAAVAKTTIANIPLSAAGIFGRRVINDVVSSDLALYGESTQLITPNLIQITRPSETTNGVTTTVNADGSITLNGTATANGLFAFLPNFGSRTIPITAEQSYTISGLTGGSALTYYLEAEIMNDDATVNYMNVFDGSRTTVAAKNGMARTYVTFKTGAVFDNLVVRPQFELGAAATPFAKYSRPTPTTPVPVVSVTGTHRIRSDSKNLVEVTRGSLTISGITYTNNGDGTITANGTATSNSIYVTNVDQSKYIRIIAGVTYSISGNPSPGGPTKFYTECIVNNDDGTLSYQATPVGGTERSFTPTKSGWAHLYVTIRSGFVASGLLFKPQLEVAAAPTPFEKRYSATQVLNLGTLELRTLPNGVTDRIIKVGDTWYLEQNVDAITFTGTEDFTAVTSQSNPDYTYVHSTNYDARLPQFTSMLSHRNNRFPHVAGMTTTTVVREDTIAIGNPLSSRVRFMILTSRLPSNNQAGVRAWLIANPTTIYFPMITPALIPITEPSIIAGLDAVRTYQGNTNLHSTIAISGSAPRDIAAMLNQALNTTDKATFAALDTNGPVTAFGSASYNAGVPTFALKGLTHLWDTYLNPGGDWNLKNTTDNRIPIIVRKETPQLMLELYAQGVQLLSNFIPRTTNTGSIGTALYRFATAFFTSLDVNGVQKLAGTGSPQGVVSAPVGSEYTDRSATNGAIVWTKKTGTGSTGWEVLHGDTGWRDVRTTLMNGWTATTFQIRRINNVVYFRGVGMNTTSATANQFFQFPAGFVNGQPFPLNYSKTSISTTPNNAVGNISYLGEAALPSTAGFGHVSANFATTEAWPVTLPGTAVA